MSCQPESVESADAASRRPEEEAAAAAEAERGDPVYRTKTIRFLGRSVPIVLQNDNGPCPLIAICNVLLLRNQISLPHGASEVGLQDLLTLVAGRLLDSNSNNEDKDDNYIHNQQQNIADAISLLPRLATGIDVNVRFRDIHDFEFTPECAIFDLLDISLVHGWLCDPQDENTSGAIGSNSYNVLVEKLVALRSSKSEAPRSSKSEAPEEPTVDFVAATTASLGVPSPTFCSRRLSDSDRDALHSSGGGQESWLEIPGSSDQASVDTENGFVAIETSAVAIEEALHLDHAPSLTFLSESLTTRKDDTTDSTEEKIDTESTRASLSSLQASEFECMLSEDCRSSLQRTGESAAGSGNQEADRSAGSRGPMEQEPQVLQTEEPLYEGEPCFQAAYEQKEPLYEGEGGADSGQLNDGARRDLEGHIIENFLSSHASQLTYHGLFSLQEGLKDRELCVFFRNNHFSTMFKYDGNIFLLVTDQGYLNEEEVVWEKITEVDGDCLFSNSSFEPSKLDQSSSGNAWNEREAVAATADYISQMNMSGVQPDAVDYSTDLQLAMALQQQEFDQQPTSQHQQQRTNLIQQQQQPGRQPSPRKSSRPSSSIGTGRLFTGGRSSSPTASKPDSKSKDKCRVM